MKKYILKSIVALCFIALSTNAWGWSFGDVNMYFDDHNSNWGSNVVIAIEADGGCGVFAMSPITNTKLHFWHTGGWGDDKVGYFRFGKTTKTYNWYGWGDDAKSTYQLALHDSWDGYTDTYGEDINPGNRMFTAAGTAWGTGLTRTVISTCPTDLNYDQNVYYAVRIGGGSYSSALSSGTTPAKIHISSYKFVSGMYNAVSAEEPDDLSSGGDTYTTNFTAAHTATTTITISEIEDGYEFEGWYDAATGGTELEDSEHLTYTYYPTADCNVYARFHKITYSLAGGSWTSDAISWTEASTQKMTLEDDGVTYSVTIAGEAVAAKTFKVIKDESYDNSVRPDNITSTTCYNGTLGEVDDGYSSKNFTLTPYLAGSIKVAYNTSTDALTVTCEAPTITFNKAGGEDGTDSQKTYSTKATEAITPPNKTGYTFIGYWSDDDTPIQVIDENGAWIKNKSGYTNNDATCKWTVNANHTFTAHWTINSYRIDVTSVENITITATPSGESAITEGSYADIEYGTEVTLAYASLTGGYSFRWKVYKTGDESTTLTISNNKFTLPDYAVTVSAAIYADPRVWCAPEDFVFSAPNGGDHLTSTKDVYVHSTSAAGNLLNIQCSDFGSATEMEIAYLNADAADAEVDKASSLFRLYDAAVTAAIDAMSSTVSISASRELDTDFSIWYKPNAYGTTNHYKLRLTLKKGDLTLKTETKDLYGRSLPEEFVIAVKNSTDGYWYALPNTLPSSGGTHTAPLKITVDNNTTPTTAVYAATTSVFKGKERNTETNNMFGIRFTKTGDDVVRGSKSSGVTNSALWLATTNADNDQVFFLKSTNFGAYEVTLPAQSVSKKLGIYSVSGTNYVGYADSPTDYDIYFLPITTKYTPRDATAYEWGEHGAIVEADMTDVALATMHIDGASPTAATVTGVNGSLGSTKYAKVDGDALTVGAVANDGKLLYIHWKNSGGDEIAASQITMPCVIAADATMSDLSTDKASWAKKEVHILPGKTLTADGASFDDSNVTVPTMYVYPGATLDITTGKLTTTTLRLRSGWTRAGTKKYDVARVHIASGKALSKSTFTLDYDIYDSSEGTHYYPIAVPLKVKVKDIDYLDPTLASASTYGTHYAIKRYNGARRAEYGAIDENWELVPDEEESEDVYILPGEGYIMTGVGLPAYGGCIIRFPLDANDNWTNDGEKASYSGFDKSVITVTHHTGAATAGGGANKRHEGWNMLANPYMACFATVGNITHSETDGFIKGHFTITGDPADPYGWTENDDNIYVSVPTHDFSEYIQKEITEAELLPGWSFFIQAAKDGNVTFAVEGQQTDSDLPIYAPKRKEAENMPTVKTGIVLSSETASDKTTFLISDKYSDEYEIGADLEKMFGNGYTLATYSLNNDTRLAFNAMSTNDAKSVIPVGIRIPADGSYTFSLNERYADADIERIDLIDYETNTVTNLTAEDYTFNATRLQNDERFAINITPRAQTPTDIGDTGIDDTNGVRKILLNETIYIIRDGRVYDATGKRVTTINK